MNKVQRTASQVFTPEFLSLIGSIPKQYVDDKHISELMNSIGKCLDKQRVSDCVVALTSYFASMLSENEVMLTQSLDEVRKFDAEDKTKSYIQ